MADFHLAALRYGHPPSQRLRERSGLGILNKHSHQGSSCSARRTRASLERLTVAAAVHKDAALDGRHRRVMAGRGGRARRVCGEAGPHPALQLKLRRDRGSSELHDTRCPKTTAAASGDARAVAGDGWQDSPAREWQQIDSRDWDIWSRKWPTDDRQLWIEYDRQSIASRRQLIGGSVSLPPPPQ